MRPRTGSYIFVALLLLLFLKMDLLKAQDRIWGVYTDAIPCATEGELSSRQEPAIGTIITDVHVPELHYYAPIGRVGGSTAIMVTPGGGYTIEAWDLEGTDIARFLSHEGYHAFVLSHRLPARLSGECRSTAALNDAQEGMLRIRSLADSLGFSADNVGVMGFSAGGHLAGSTSVHARESGARSSRPDFSVLVYPVTIMEANRSGHAGSQHNLVGDDPASERLPYFNLPMQVDSLTPPTLLIHASDDTAVLPENSLEYYSALVSQGVPADLRIYANGGHGFGSARERPGPVSTWLDEVVKWLNAR